MTRFLKAGGGRILARPVVEARLEAERIRREAEERGYQEGLARATEILLRSQESVTRSEQQLGSLAVRISEKILGRELSLRPELIADLCDQALAQARGRKRIVVRLNPADLDLVRKDIPVTWREDPTIARGDCVIETEAGVVDARLSSQLMAIERALEDA